MSPELLDPSRLGDRGPRPTKESDCFALGMVIYEVCVRNQHPSPFSDDCSRSGRCYVVMRRTTVGIYKELEMPYCGGFGRANQKQRCVLDLLTNCGRWFSAVGVKIARHDRTCKPFVLA